MKKYYVSFILTLILSLFMLMSVFAYNDDNLSNNNQYDDSMKYFGAFLPEIPYKYYGGYYYDIESGGALHIKIVDTTPEGKDLLLLLQELNKKASAVNALNSETVFEGGAVYTYRELEEATHRIGNLELNENGHYAWKEFEFDEKPELIRWKVDIRQNSLIIIAKEWNEVSMKKMSEFLGIEIDHIIFETANYTIGELEEALDKVVDAKLHKDLNVLEMGLRTEKNSIYVVAEKWDTELKKEVVKISGLKKENIIFIIYEGEIDSSNIDEYETKSRLINEVKAVFKI
ncbi:hypothetical protein AAK894_09405 [Lachnospiraceae bacterium 46-61]